MSTRFVIRRNLGKGVFEAQDAERGTTVALKRLASSSSASADAQLRFKNEFRSLADVLHPNLAALYELFVDEDGLSFTMELVRGVHFIDAFRDRWLPRSKRLDFDKVRDRLRQLAAGVQAIHGAGMLHRDLKHSNVLVEDGTGRVVILDFGLVADLDPLAAPPPSAPASAPPPALRPASVDDEAAGIVRISTSQPPSAAVKQPGTPPYMAPELFAGKAPSAASDWYAVGVMLYELLTGSALFRAPLADVLVEKRRALAPVQALAPEVPDDLAALCDALVDRDPQRRPIPFGATTDTATATARSAQAQAPPAAGRAAHPVVEARAEELVGRERELAALDGAFAARPALALVHGPSGIGKSALIEAFLARRRGALVVDGKCYERETVPFKAFDGVIDALARHLASQAPGARAALVPKEAAALARLFPALGFIKSDAAALDPGLDPVELRRRGFAALRELLTKLAEAQPLAIVIDDLQWGDVDSALLLDELLRAPAPPFFVLGAFRSEERESSPFLRRLLARARPKSIAVVDVAVAELAHEDAVRLARRKLGNDGGADAIAQESGGHPFFIDELVRFAKSGAALRDRSKPDVARAILARCERLPDSARHLLEVTALASAPLDRRAAAAAARIVTDDEHALATLRSSHLVRVRTASDAQQSRQLLETYHDRIRETVVAALSPDERKFLHAHLATALEELPDTDAEALAHHLHGAGDDARAAHFAEKAAQQAQATLAFFRAARLYDMALSLGGSKALHETRARALVNAGQCAEAAKAFLAAASFADANDAGHARDLRRQAAEMFLLSGRTDEGLAIFRDVLAGVGMTLRPSSAITLASILLQQLRMRMSGTAFVPRSGQGADELFQIDVCCSVSVGLATGGADAMTALDFQERYVLAALAAGEPRRAAHALAREAMSVAIGTGIAGRSRVDAVLAQSEAIAKTLPDDPYLEGHRLLCRGIATFFFDRFAQAIDEIGVAERMLRDRCTGVWPEISQAHFYRLGAWFALDRWKALDEDAARVFIEGEENGDAYTMANCELNLSRSWLMRDDPEQAVALVDDVARRWSTAGFQLVHWLILYHRSYALLYAGKAEAAYAGLSSTWRRVTRSLILRVPLLHVYAHQVRAACALSVGRLDEAAALAKKLARPRTAWASCRALLLQAAVAFGRGDVDGPGGAVARLRRSMALAEDASLPMHQALARMRLGGIVGDASLVDEGRAFLFGEGIVDPDRIADMLAPGFSRRRDSRDRGDRGDR